MVERQTYNLDAAGPIPATPTASLKLRSAKHPRAVSSVVERPVYTGKVGGSIPSPRTKTTAMAEIKEFKPSTIERPKPEKPADIIDIESGKKKKQLIESVDTSSVLADAFDLVREGQLTEAEIDALKSISENEKTLLKVVSDLFEALRKKDEIVEMQKKSLAEMRSELDRLEQKLKEFVSALEKK